MLKKQSLIRAAQALLLPLILISHTSLAFDIYGHRGARGLAPENTLPGYKTALALNVDYVDMDVAMTRDHVLVVQHDLSLNPDITRDRQHNWINDKSILIKNLSLAELRNYDVGRIKTSTAYAEYFPQQKPMDGTRIPTLKEVIEYVKAAAGDRVGFQIEIKTDPSRPDDTYSPREMAAAVAKVVAEEGITDRTQVQSFDWRNLLALQEINPKIATAYLTDTIRENLMRDEDPSIAGMWTAGRQLKDYHGSIPQMIRAMGGKYWDPQDAELTADEVREAHKLGLKVITWTNNTVTGNDVDIRLTRKMIAMKVDGIITDRPDEVSKLKTVT